MTPARLQAMCDVDEYVREQADKGKARRPSSASASPASDLASFAGMTIR